MDSSGKNENDFQEQNYHQRQNKAVMGLGTCS